MQKYLVLTHLNSDGVDSTITSEPELVAFEVSGEKVEINKYLRTFVWFNSMTRNFHIHEEVSGGYLGAGSNLQEAFLSVQRNLMATGEDTFFAELRKLGTATDKKRIELGEALRRMAIAKAKYMSGQN